MKGLFWVYSDMLQFTRTSNTMTSYNIPKKETPWQAKLNATHINIMEITEYYDGGHKCKCRISSRYTMAGY